jgi:type I restriction enzyme S subunit
MKWPIVPLGEITKMVGGGTPSKKQSEFWSGDLPWVSPKDMNKREIWDTQDHISDEAVAQSATQMVPVGSVLVVVRSGILVRRFPVAIARIPVALNQDMKALIPERPLGAEFLACFLEASSEEILSLCVKRGATVHSIDVSKLERYPVPIPARSEQQQIVQMLKQASDLQKKRAEADLQFGNALPALFYEMFGDPAKNQMRWRVARLGDVFIESQYGTSVKATSDGKGVPVIRMNNIDSAGFMELDHLKYSPISDNDMARFALAKGDILFNRTNSKELVGKTGLWHGEMKAVAASYLIRVRTDHSLARPEYIWAYLNTPFMKQILFDKARRAIGMANINAEELKNFPVMVPRMDVQEVFSNRLALLNKVREDIQESRRKLKSLQSNLQHRAFSGELTARWRGIHAEELLVEIEQQARILSLLKEKQPC